MTDFEYVCSERLITATIGGTRGIASVSFRPDRVTRIPKKVFQALCEKKSSPANYFGEQAQSPMLDYLDSGMLWTVTAQQAQAIAEGKASIVSPRGPLNRHLTISPEMPKEGRPTSEAQEKIIADIEKSSPTEIEAISTLMEEAGAGAPEPVLPQTRAPRSTVVGGHK